MEKDFKGELWNKFPDFDPQWSDAVKLKWFEVFNAFLEPSCPKPIKKAPTGSKSGRR